ncbi:MAG TPA: FAD-dependent monooxygenase [Gemmatimonadaceae bacterium]
MRPASDLDVLIVGAGPTGLALAAQLHAFGTRFRIIDRLEHRGHESRALGVQARTLELLQTIGLGEALVARGNASTHLVLHLDGHRVAEVALGTIGATDTRFPFILFISQAETEALLCEHLAASGVRVERGLELESAEAGADGVRCVLRHGDGREERVEASYLAGCDGAHSAVRRLAGIPFEGGSYPQQFVLGDVEADGPLTPGAINAFAGRGVAMFFPLGAPTTWRVIAMSATGRPGEESDGLETSALTLAELQAIVDVPTGDAIRVRDPAWLGRFHLHHRQTAHYRAGRLFLAGDAAHVHSPVGAQGMNTGIQDAWNLGWKLALVARGEADPRLLDSYEAERWPVGRFLVRYTDRLFGAFTRAMSSSAVAGWARRRIMPTVLPRVFGSRLLGAAAFRFVSELGIRYRRSSAVSEGAPRLRGGPRAGDRLPDARVTVDGRPAWLQEAVVAPRVVLLLCGNPAAWDTERLAVLRSTWPRTLTLRYLANGALAGALADAPVDALAGARVLVDESGDVLARLGVRHAAQYLVRPDGHVAFRCAGSDLAALARYLGEWLVPPPRNAPRTG